MSQEIGALFRANRAKKQANSAPEIWYRSLGRLSQQCIPSWRKPATKVIVFQCPCGTDAINRSPRGQRPLSSTMFVLVAVSSINTSRAGSSMPCSRIQRRRARATSARFCSAACRLFFKADIVSIKETLESAPTAGDALFSHGGENLLEGQIRLFGNQSQDPVRVLFQWRNTPAARFRRRAPCLTPALAPSNYRTNAHLEDIGYLPPRRSAFNRFNRTLTQVRGIRPRHRFSSPANQFPQIRLGDSGWESLRFNADGKCSSFTEIAHGVISTPLILGQHGSWSLAVRLIRRTIRAERGCCCVSPSAAAPL